ncbi:MAG: M2 family metallopeptidase, partial [Sphingomonadales bacterium]
MNNMNNLTAGAIGLLLGATAVWIIAGYDSGPAPEPVPTAAEAATFVAEVEKVYEELGKEASHVFWINANFVTYDTDELVKKASEEFTALGVKYANDAKRFNGLELPADVRRKIDFLKQGLTLPAPNDPAKNKELAEITTDLNSMYARGKYCRKDDDCITDRDIIRTMATSRDADELLDVWKGWRTISPPMRDKYTRMVEIANEGAVELGYANVGDLWRAGYDMKADAFAAEVDRLWGDVKPLYDSLHCYVKDRLIDQYGDAAKSEDGMIPAHLLGNVWAQTWGNIFDLVAEGGSDPGYDLTKILQGNGF